MNIGFIGLGSMGLEMARRLQADGHQLTGYDLDPAKGEALVSVGVRLAKTLRELTDCEIIISMLPNDDALRAVFYSDDGLIDAMSAQVIHLSMATISPEMSKRLTASHHEAGGYFVAAPVLGRPERAAQGKLFIIAAGAPDAVDICRPLFEILGERTFDFGAEPYLANTVKIAFNFMTATAIESLGESFALVRKAGVDAEQFLELVTNSLFSCVTYDAYAPMVAREICEPAAFRLDLGLKDVNLVIDAANQFKVPLPIASVLQTQMIGALARDYGDRDWAVLGVLNARNAGLKQLDK